jgi:hypothetical protein
VHLRKKIKDKKSECCSSYNHHCAQGFQSRDYKGHTKKGQKMYQKFNTLTGIQNLNPALKPDIKYQITQKLVFKSMKV